MTHSKAGRTDTSQGERRQLSASSSGGLRRIRELLMEVNQLRAEADLEHKKRSERLEQMLRELMAATLTDEQRGPAAR